MKSSQIKSTNTYLKAVNNKPVEAKEFNELQADVTFLYPKEVNYSTSVPFNFGCSVVFHTLISDDTLTPDTQFSIVGGGAIYRLLGDGSHSPTFSGFYQSGSGTYDSTLNAVNLITFLYDGISYWYSITQPAT